MHKLDWCLKHNNIIGGVPYFKDCEKGSCNKHIDNRILYFDKSIGNYVCWSCYKEKFIDIGYSDNFIKKLKENYDNVELFSTFRTQDSEDWSGGARSAFERNLIERDISWFVYVKFYHNKNKNKIEPLVVGKTGSLLVNISGTDVDFSEDENDGPARRFL